MEKPNIVTVEATERPKGKTALKKMRSEFKVPAVAYGPKLDKNLHVTIPNLSWKKCSSPTEPPLSSWCMKEKSTKRCSSRWNTIP
jgi:large subunit ribosomal protein L25